MNGNRLCLTAGALLLAACSSQGGEGPTPEQFKAALDAQLQALRPGGMTERTVLFENVRVGKSNGPRHSFSVTATVHDYGPGYPSNGYYGQTCVGRMDNWIFEMVPNAMGDWVVQGRMTVTDNECRNNPAEGQAAVPVTSLAGQRAAAVAMPPPPEGGSLALGEYACYGTGSQLMAGMGFVLSSDGSYADLDDDRGGNWQYDEGSASIRFSGGFLDGQRGSGVSAEGFAITDTVSCEPY
ncbi:MAG: hypothetical protein IPK97_08855 [Ahniella sp.]|nr:hypothetical protein [Ahniella sp.]